MTATASDLAAFLASILEAPEDEGPRLVLADFDEEYNVLNPRGMCFGPLLRLPGRWLLIPVWKDGAVAYQRCNWTGHTEEGDFIVDLGPTPGVIPCQWCVSTPEATPGGGFQWQVSFDAPKPATQRLYGEWRCQEHTDPRRLADVPWQSPEQAFGVDRINSPLVVVSRTAPGNAPHVLSASASWLAYQGATDGPLGLAVSAEDREWVAVEAPDGRWLFSRLRHRSASAPEWDSPPTLILSRWELASVGPFYRVGADGALTRYRRPVHNF